MVAKVTSRSLTPGTTGWCAHDLDDPDIRRQWDANRVEMIEGVIATMPCDEPKKLVPGAVSFSVADLLDPDYLKVWDANRYELVRGVIAQMPPPSFEHGSCVHELLFMVRTHLRDRGIRSWSSSEVDLVVGEFHVFRADGVLLVEADMKRQRRRFFDGDDVERKLKRLTLPPTLVIESASVGRERHDFEVKREHYAQFGIPNYWIVDAGVRSLLCLRLRGKKYVEDCEASDVGVINPSAFPGLAISLKEVFF